MIVSEYIEQINAITEPAEVAMAELRKKSEASVSLSDIFKQMEQYIMDQVSTQVHTITEQMLKTLLPNMDDAFAADDTLGTEEE